MFEKKSIIHTSLTVILLSFFCKVESALAEKPLAVVVTSYNNKDWYKANLNSIFAQNYSNYRVIYLDDCSPDGTGQLVANYIKERHLEDKVTLIRQQNWVSQMANHYYAVYMCDDNEIVVHIDGDDELHGANVFNIVNELYSKNDIWLTYGTPLRMPSGHRWPGMDPRIMHNVMATNTFREVSWDFSHLRTFYAWLFKQIKLQDLIISGSFKPMSPAPDVAFLTVLCELAGFKSMAIPDLVYIYNEKNPLSQYKITPSQGVQRLLRRIFSWPKYQPLQQPVNNCSKKYNESMADLILIANQSDSIGAVLSGIKQHLSSIDKISVVHQNEIDQSVKQQFADVTFVSCAAQEKSCKEVIQSLVESATEHVIFCSTRHMPTQSIDVNFCIRELERTFSYAFYMHVAYEKSIEKNCAPVSSEVIGWQPYQARGVWPTPNRLGMILYRKQDIHQAIAKMNGSSMVDFQKALASYWKDKRATGLFFKQKKMS